MEMSLSVWSGRALANWDWPRATTERQWGKKKKTQQDCEMSETSETQEETTKGNQKKNLICFVHHFTS